VFVAMLPAAFMLTALRTTPAEANGAFPAALSVFFPPHRPDALIVATNFGVVESTDGGRSWLYACEDQTHAADARFYSLVQDGDRERLFSVGLQGLAVSDDGGCTLQSTAGSSDFVTVSDYFVDPSNAQRVVALATVVDPAATVVESAAVLVSQDGGQTFGPPLRSEPVGMPDSLDFESVEVARSDPQTIYLISSSILAGRQLERSADGGLTWQTTPLPAGAGSRFGIITVDPNDKNRVFVRGTNFASDVLILTTDGGKTLRTVLDLGPQMAAMTAFLLRKDGTILIAAVDVRGVTFGLKSSDGGQTFQPWEIGSHRLRGLAEHGGRIYALSEYTTDSFILGSAASDSDKWEPLLTFGDIRGIKPCAQSRCAADCLRLADLGVWKREICAPASSRDASASDGQTERSPGGGAGCSCQAAGAKSPSSPWPLLGMTLATGLGALWRGRRGRRRMRPGWIAGLVLLTSLGLATGCKDGDQGSKTITPWFLPGYEQVPLAIPVDLDPDPRRLEILLRARPASLAVRAGGKPVALWTYDGWLPGPLIRAKRGDTLTVRLRNELDAPTTIHWHGVRVPNAMDGTHHTQVTVSPGGEFVYTFPLVDAGTFWYHPHHVSNQQVGMGLYAPLLVDADDAPPGLGEPAVLVLGDLRLDADGNLLPYDQGGIEAGKVGREGTVLLVNGRQNPTITLQAGRRHRWLLVNATPNHFLRIAVAGHALTRIGGDGGLLEKPLPEVPDLLLVPGERADIVFVAKGNPGDRVSVDILPYDRGAGESAMMHLMDLNLAPTADPSPLGQLPTSLRTIEPLKPAADAVAEQLSVGERPTGFVINDGLTTALEAKVGDLRLYDIVNHTIYDHPFHLHGFFFQVVDPLTSAPGETIEWKDTYNVRALTVARFAVRYDDRPGMWMLHCHILDHAEAGLFATIDLKP
jgi:FtsP/CotA-like multicopper oxidase with cupredoxin domain/photosystem II stability/assembly factor-like uncharacterized protein